MALVLGLLATVVWYWPMLASGFDQVPGDRGDARATVYMVEHWYQVLRGNAEVLSPAMFYPIKGTIGYMEAMILHAFPYSGLRLAGVDMFTAFAIPVVLFGFLNYAACYYLLRRVLGLRGIASVAGAMFFAFNSPRASQAGHWAYQAAFLLPIIAVCLVRFLHNRSVITQARAFGLLAAAALALALQFLILPYQGWFVVFWLCLLAAIVFLAPSTRRSAVQIARKFWPALTGAALVFGAGLIPFFLVYMPVANSVGPRPYPVASTLTPDAWSLIQMGERNYVWGGLATAVARVHPLGSTELNIGIGLVPSLALLGLMLWSLKTIASDFRDWTPNGRTDSRRVFVAATILACALFYAIGMRYWGGASPWQFVYEFVPGANGLRAIARYVLVLALPMSIGFALAMHRCLATISVQPTALARRGMTAALLAVATFGIFEQLARPRTFSARSELSRVEALAASLPKNCGVFYAAAAPVQVPMKHEYQIDAMLVSAISGVPTVNGYSGHVPPGWTLREVETPDYEQRVARWIAQHHVPGPVCRIEIAD